MRNPVINYTIRLIVTLMVFTSCNPVVKIFNKNGKAIIAGKIINHEKHPDIHTVKIFIKEPGNPTQKIHTAYLDKNGSFVFRFEKYQPQNIFFEYGTHIPLFISPGDSLHLKFKADEFIHPGQKKYNRADCIEFTGDGAQINKNLNSFISGVMKISTTKGFRTSNEKNLAPDDYKSYLMTEREDRLEFLQSFINSHQVSDTFIKWAHYYIDYDCGRGLLHYTWFHPFSTQKRKRFDVMDLPEDYFSFLDQLQLNNKPAFNCTAYYDFLHEHSLVLYEKKSQFDKKYSKEGRKFIKSKEFKSEYKKHLGGLKKQYSGAALEHLLSQKICSLLEHYNRMDVFEELYPKYEKTINVCFSKIIHRKYKELKEEEKNIEKEKKGKTGSVSIFQNVLEKHKGKVIYIDILATWCGPCLMELPFSVRLKEEFNGKNVSFVYFCVKSKKRKWESILSDLKIKGDPYLLNDTQYNILSERFQINGIPRYILVNKEGAIVDKNAQRPSYEGGLNINLIDEINSLIKN